MYRADRFSRIEHSNRAPVVVTAFIVLVLAVALACGTNRSNTKTDTTVLKPATPSTQPTVGGDVAQSSQSTTGRDVRVRAGRVHEASLS